VRLLPGALAIVIGIAGMAGCGSPASSGSPPAASLSPVMAAPYACDTVPFLPGALLQPGAAERDDDAAAEALRQFLSRPENDFMPATGWRRLGRSGPFMEFANFIADPAWNSYVSVTFEADRNAWRPFRWGSCEPRRVVTGNTVSLAWWLPEGVPDQAGRSIAVSVIVDGCNAGPAEEGIEPPLLDIAGDAVTIILTSRRDPNPDCPAGGPTPWTIDLPEEIGTRALLDGSVFPGRDATTEPLGFGGIGG